MGSKPKSPPPPDTVGAAKAEAAGNKEVAQITAGYNRPTQIDPYGSTTWAFKGDTAGQAAIQQQRDQALAELNRVLAIPKPVNQPRDGVKNTQNQQAWQAQRDAAQAAYNQRIQALGGARGTPDNPRPGDWIQTTTLSPQQAAILAAEQGNDLALQNLATQGVGIAQDVLGRQFDPNIDPVTGRPSNLPQLQGLSGIGASQFSIPTANFNSIQLPNWQNSQLGLPQYQGPQGSMPQYQGPAGSVPQASALGGQVPQYTGPQGNMPQFGADTVGMAANRLNNMNRLGESNAEFSNERAQTIDAMYQQLTRFNQQRFSQEEEAERTRLANMGFTQGTAAYDRALQEFRRSKDEAYQGAQLAAITAGGAEQSRLRADQLAARTSNIGLGQAQFGQDQARYQQGLTERQAQFGAGMDTRNQQLQEQLARFETGLSGRQQQQAELESLYGRQLQSRQQGVQEATTRFQAGMAGREQQLAEAQARQQALAQNYGLGLDERQTAFQANLARQGMAMDRTQAQLTADANRYQMGLGERQAQQQSQMNQAALAAQQRQQLFQERAFQRSLPLNEVTALMSGSGVTMPQFAGFQPMQAWQGPQLLDAEMGRYNAQLGAANAANASRGQTLGALGGLAMAGATAY